MLGAISFFFALLLPLWNRISVYLSISFCIFTRQFIALFQNKKIINFKNVNETDEIWFGCVRFCFLLFFFGWMEWKPWSWIENAKYNFMFIVKKFKFRILFAGPHDPIQSNPKFWSAHRTLISVLCFILLL